MVELRMIVLRLMVALLMLVWLAPLARAQELAPAGQFDYYLLALSWSPAYCRAHRNDPRARDECGRRRGFVVHGLWPQNEDGTWPAFCRPVPPVPPPLAAREAETMPNAELVRHEWEKHGSCTGLSVETYFAALDRVFARLVIPPALVRPKAAVTLSLAEGKALFAAANPGLTESMFSMRCTHNGEVDELRLCLDKSLRYRICGRDSADSCPSMMHFDAIPGAGD